MNVLNWIKRNRVKSAGGAAMAILLCTLLIFVVGKRVSPVSWGWFGQVNNSAGLVLKGYDPVAYHQNGMAVKGVPSIAWTWKSVEWHFASSGNRAIFQTDPQKYAPSFGSYCARAVSAGFTADGDPEVWHVEKGKLYVFLDETARQTWVSRIDQGIIAQSEAHWAKR